MKKVLLVDDSGIILRNMKEMLTADYEVALAVSGKMALTVIEKGKPDIILMDYEMPEMNGVETLNEIRKTDEYKDIPVIFLTGAENPEAVEIINSVGSAGYVLKPVTKPVILETIERVIGR